MRNGMRVTLKQSTRRRVSCKDLLLLAGHLSALDAQRLFGVFHLCIDQLEFRFQLRYLNQAHLSVNYACLHRWRDALRSFGAGIPAMTLGQRGETCTTAAKEPRGI